MQCWQIKRLMPVAQVAAVILLLPQPLLLLLLLSTRAKLIGTGCLAVQPSGSWTVHHARQARQAHIARRHILTEERRWPEPAAAAASVAAASKRSPRTCSFGPLLIWPAACAGH